MSERERERRVDRCYNQWWWAWSVGVALDVVPVYHCLQSVNIPHLCKCVGMMSIVWLPLCRCDAIGR